MHLLHQPRHTADCNTKSMSPLGVPSRPQNQDFFPRVSDFSLSFIHGLYTFYSLACFSSLINVFTSINAAYFGVQAFNFIPIVEFSSV